MLKTLVAAILLLGGLLGAANYADAAVNVQHGTLGLTGTTQDVTIDAVNPANAWVRHTARVAGGADDQDVTVELISSTTLRFTRYVAGGTLNIEWQVIEDSAATVQRGTTSVGSGSVTVTDAITTIDQGNTFITLTSRTNQGSDISAHQGFYAGYFSANDELTFVRGASGSESVISWEVVTISDATVQSATSTMTGGSDSDTITSVATSSTFIVAHNSAGSSNLSSRHVRVSLTNPTTVSLNRGGTTGTTITSWFVVEVPRYTVQAVSSGSFSTQQIDVTISAVSTSSTWTLGTSDNSGTGQSNTNSKYTLLIPDSTTWRRLKDSTSQTTNVTGYVISMTASVGPEVTVAPSTNITAQSATFNGEIIDSGSSGPTTRGFIYSTSADFSAGVATTSSEARYDISTATFDSIVLDVSTQETAPNAILFNDDGTTLYVLGSSGDDINAYPLSTPYDISSYTSGTSVVLSVASEELQPNAMIFNNNGTTLYVMGQDGNDINAYTLTTPYDISTATFTSIVLDVSGQEIFPWALLYNDTGTVLYMMGRGGDDINAYTLSTPYDISTATFDSIVLDVSAQELGPRDLLFNNTGTVLYMLGNDGDDINAYTLSTPYDISTATFDSIVLDVLPQESSPNAMLFNNDGTTLFVTGSSGDDINAYTLRDSFATGTYALPVTDLEPGATYYVRAFAENDAGVEYSSATGSFTTSRSITITGTLYENDGVTPMGAGKTIVAAVGTSTVSLHSTTTDASGNYVIEGIAASTANFSDLSTTTEPAGSMWTKIAYGNGMFVAGGTFFGTSRLMYSYDGINWTNATYSNAPNITDITYGKGLFVAVATSDGFGATERILTSSDGITWTSYDSPDGSSDTLRGIAYGEGRFVAVRTTFAPDPAVIYSDDGVNWATTTAVGDDDNWFGGVVYGNSRFVASGYGGGADDVMYSDDGLTWSAVQIDNGDWLNLTYGNGIFMAVDGNVIATSSDGSSWSTTTVPLNVSSTNFPNSLVYGNGMFVGVRDCSSDTAGDCVMYSTDNGATWATSTIDSAAPLSTAGYGAGRWVLLSDNTESIVRYTDAGFGEDTPITLFVDENATTSSSTATTLTYGLNNNSGTTTITADLVADTVLLQKTSVGNSSNEIRFDDRAFYDSFDAGDTDVLFTATTSTTTINADLRIASGTVVYAPQHLVIDGDWANYGTFEAERGEVVTDATAFDVLSARYQTSFDISGQEGTSRGIAISIDGLKMFVIGWDGDDVNEYDLSVPFDVSTATFVDATSLSGLGVTEDFPNDLFFKPDGSELYIVGESGDRVYQFTLSSTYDASTMSFTASTSISAQEAFAHSLHINPDGTKMFILGAGGREVDEYTLSIPWDITSASFVDATPVFDEIDGVTDIRFDDSGYNMFIVDVDTSRIYLYALTTPFDASTRSVSSVIGVGSSIAKPQGSTFGMNGSILYLVSLDDDVVAQFSLDDNQTFTGNFSATSSLYDFTIGDTATISPAATTEIDNDYHVGGSAAGPFAGLVELTGTSTLSGTGNFGFVEVQGSASSTESSATFTDLAIASGGDFTAPAYGTLNISGDFDPSAGSFDVNNATTYFGGQGTYNLELGFVASLDVSAQDFNQNGLAFSPDGTKMYMHGYNGADPLVYEYTLNIPGDVSTAVYIQASSTAAEDTYGTGLAFSPDGSRLITSGYNSNNLNSYSLSTPWDISTLRFETATSIVSQTGSPTDVKMNADGSRVFVLSETRTVYEYEITEPYNMETARYVRGGSLSGMVGFPITYGLDFSPDGNALFIAPTDGVIRKYAMDTPWDITNTTLVDEYDFGTGVGLLNFASDGTTLYFDSGNDVYQYSVVGQIATTTGANALGAVEFSASGTTAFTGNASTSDFTVGENATVTAPALLSVGDFENYGSFDSNSGTIYSTGAGSFDLTRAYLVATTSLTFVGNPRGGYVSPDEAHLYGVDFFDTITRYELTTPGDLSTASSSGTYTVSDAADLFISNDGTRMYVGLANNNHINQYTLGTAWDIRTASFVASTTLSELTDTEYGVFINPAGTDMFVNSSDSSGTLAHYTLSPAWDVTSAVFVASETGQAFTNIRDFVFNTAGTRLFTSNDRGQVKEYILTEPWTIAGMTGADNLSGWHVLLQQLPTSNGVNGMAFNGTQDTLYVIAGASPNMQQYSIPATFRGTLTGADTLTDLTTTGGYTILLDQASTTNITVNSGSELQTPTSSLSIAGSLAVNGKLETTNQGGVINFTGTTQTISGNLIGSSTLPQVNITGTYTLSDTASTSVLTIASGGSLIAPNATLSIAGDYTNNGTFTAGSGEVVIDTPSPRLTNLTSVGSLDVSAYDGNVSGAAFSEDGTTLYFVGGSNRRFSWVTLSTPFDVTTAGSVSSSSLTSVLQADPAELVISPDGTNVYMVDTIYDAPNGFSHDIMQFSMNPAWDASSLSFVASTTDSFGQIDGLAFSADGSKLYYTRESQSVLYTYALGMPWDITTLTGGRLRTAPAHTLFTFGHAFSPAGDRLLSLGFFGEIVETTLDVPFDTFSLDRTSSMIDPNAGSDYRSINFSPDGKYILVTTAGLDEIRQFQVATDPIVSGTMTGSSAFNNLTQNTDLPMTFGTSASTTGTFAIEPSGTATSGATTTIFNAGSTYTFENIDWAGASSTNELVLRSSASGTLWYLDVPGSQLNVEYVNVQDSDATQSAAELVAATSTDSGNNTNWCFADCGATPADVWNPTDWTLYDTITIDATQVDDDLTDFPVYVDLADLSATFWSTVSDGGGDIRVTTNAGSPVELAREVVSASTTLQTGELHFKANSISSTTDTVFRIYYNGTTTGDYAVDATYGAQNVWTNDYIGVWHLGENGNNNVGGYLDSTQFANHGTGTSMTAASGVVAQLGSGQDFDGENDIIKVPRADVLEPTASVHYSAWIKRNGAQDEWAKPVWYGYNASPFGVYGFESNGSADDQFRAHITSEFSFHQTGSASIADNTWYLLNGSYDGSVLRLYEGATEIASTSVATTIDYTNNDGLGIGSRYSDGSTRAFTGAVDEVRIASTSRSAAWISAEYVNQSTTTDFYSVSAAGGPIETGSSTIANHSSGQVNNAFNFQNKTNETLFAFNLDPTSGPATTTNLVFTLSGVDNVSASDFSNLRLYVDNNSDAAFDGGDTEVASSGVMSINGRWGTITFTDDFAVTAAEDYILVADWNAPERGAFMTVNLYAADLTIGAAASTAVVSGTTGSPSITTDVSYNGETGSVYEWSGAGSITFSTGGEIDYLVVAGGGGGAGWNDFRGAGGGGAGGMLSAAATVGALETLTVTVGAGGAGGDSTPTEATSGGNSSLVGNVSWVTVEAIGGGRGGAQNTAYFAGGAGGSGGAPGETSTLGAGTAGQGNDSEARAGGGGGGAGEAGGTDGVEHGGDGLQSSITGSALYYAGGGAGTDSSAPGGLGGGGDGTNVESYESSPTLFGDSGVDGLGGGGGAASTWSGSRFVVGGDGGDGTVILFVPDSSGTTQTIFGSVDHIQHSRNNRGGGGGSSAAIGTPAPVGDGDVGGGGADGGDDGGAIDTNTGGGLIGSSPNFNNPTAGSGAWNGIANAYDQTDGTYATTDAANSADFTDHTHSVPGTNTIEGIAVKLEISGTTAAGSIGVALSWNGGINWTTPKNTPTLTTTDTVVTLGGPSDLWGRTWTPDMFSNANFAVRLTGAPSDNTIQVDAIQVRVYNQASGGGGGGGGAI